jgi:hypothetical protein
VKLDSRLMWLMRRSCPFQGSATEVSSFLQLLGSLASNQFLKFQCTSYVIGDRRSVDCTATHGGGM